MKKFFLSIGTKLKSMLPQDEEHPESRYFKLMVWGFIAVFFAVVVIGSLTFFLTLRGDEVTMVPNLQERELVNALEELQSRGLHVNVQQRFFSDPDMRGRVIDQSPDPGSQVRVGRVVNITVSQGPVVDQVGDYVGLTIDELRAQLAAQFANFNPLLEVRAQNISYVFSEVDAGVIISQQPSAGEQLNGYTDLELVVSRGPEVLGIESPEVTGLDYRQALGLLAVRNIPFVFRVSTQEGANNAAGLVVSQYPEPGEMIEPDSALVLRINPVTGNRNQVADIFYSYIPEFAVPVVVEVDFITTDGVVQDYFQTRHSGGELSFPYVLEMGSIINVYADGSLISRYTVQAPAESADS